MDNRQKEALEIKNKPKGFYHLCTDGTSGTLFNNREQFRYGMCTIALIALQFPVEIYTFELMPTHLHMMLEATGETCLKVFQFFRHRCIQKLRADGFPLIPEDYWFKLISLHDEKSQSQNFIYLTRNPYEKDYCIPGTYPWGSGYLFFNKLAPYISGTRVEKMKGTELRLITGSKVPLPDHWEIHPELGVLPKNYIRTEFVKSLFDSPKAYMTKMVKDYESFVHLAQVLHEEISFSKSELDDIVYGKARAMYPGKMIKELTGDEKGRLAVALERQYHLSVPVLANRLFVSERTVLQFLSSKDYGYRQW